MRKVLLAVAMLACSPFLVAQAMSDEGRRIAEAATVLDEIISASDQAVPRAIIEKAEGIAVFPSTIKGGLVIGGQRGRGVLSVRDGKNGGWSAATPAPPPTSRCAPRSSATHARAACLPA